MKAFQSHRGKAALLDQSNIDTDQIIPKQFLKSTSRTGYGEHLFYHWRTLADGTPNEHFAHNRKEFVGASILVTRTNFGCGSSREHAVWALQQFGFQVIIAEETPDSPAFADIFRANAIQNGLLPIALPTSSIDEIVRFLRSEPPLEMSIDLKTQNVLLRTRSDKKFYSFDFPAPDKERLLKGLDEIDVILLHEGQIRAFESKHRS